MVGLPVILLAIVECGPIQQHLESVSQTSSNQSTTTQTVSSVECNQSGWLDEPCYSLCLPGTGSKQAYNPQTGDLVFFDDNKFIYPLLYKIAKANRPAHIGIVIINQCGQPWILEAGYQDSLRCRYRPLNPRLQSYKGSIYVRQRMTPLSTSQSDALLCFARKLDGGRFALMRFAGQLTTFRARGRKIYKRGKAKGLNRRGYLCSEAVVEALVFAGLLDKCSARPSATYPKDLFFEYSDNCYLAEHLDLNSGWLPPAYWRSCEMFHH